MILLPKDPSEKIALVHHLFKVAKQSAASDTAAVKSVLEKLGKQISERSIWNYKKQWEANPALIAVEVVVKDVEVLPTIIKEESKRAKGKKARAVTHQIKQALAKQFFPEAEKTVTWIDPNQQFEPEEIKKHIYDVCSELTIGNKGFMNILDSRGITLYLWNKWLDSDEEYIVIFERAKSQQSISYYNRIQDAMRKIAMAYLSFEEVREESIQYEFVERQDPEDASKFIYVEVPRFRIVKTKPQKPDTQTMKSVIDMMRETMRQIGNADNEDINEIMAMNELQLKELIGEMEKERGNRKDAN
jgi:hypothetical protein